MPLPILHTSAVSDDDLVRFFHKAELHWARHLGEEEQFEFGTAISNSQIPNVYDANRMLGVSLPEDVTPEQAFGIAQDHFARQGTRCSSWSLAPSSEQSRTSPMADYLLGHDHIIGGHDVMHLDRQPTTKIDEVAGLTIIPARASFRHVRELSEESAADWNEPQLVETSLMHLDDPHVDGLLALKDGKAAGKVFVLAVGEIGSIEHVYTAKAFRRQGVARTLMSRALEICARSLFKHILLGVDSENTPAVSLYTSFGFRRIGRYITYRPKDIVRA